MNDLARMICLLGLLILAGCSGAADHSPEDGAAEHANDDDTHEHDTEDTHDHDDGSHTHEAPATEAFYGDDTSSAHAMAAPDAAEQAATQADAEAEEMHSHGDGEPHTHEH